MALFESYERRIDNINAVLNSYGIASIEEAEQITKDAGLDVYNQVKSIQPICFFFQKHFTKVTMSKTYFTLVSYRTRDTKD